jgi:hypothetical protein
VALTHPLGCHRPRIPDRLVFEHVVAALVHGCGYERIATPTCSDRTIRLAVTQLVVGGRAQGRPAECGRCHPSSSEVARCHLVSRTRMWLAPLKCHPSSSEVARCHCTRCCSPSSRNSLLRHGGGGAVTSTGRCWRTGFTSAGHCA